MSAPPPWRAHAGCRSTAPRARSAPRTSSASICCWRWTVPMRASSWRSPATPTSAPRCGCCANSILAAPARRTSTCPIPTTALPAASRKSSTSCRPPARGCWSRLARTSCRDAAPGRARRPARRLLPLASMARERAALSAAGSDAVERLCGRLRDLAGPPEPPARLHGDLWSGNVMAGADGRPWLIDPSAYGGHREVDLAMLRLFGAPSDRVFAAYDELAPPSPGRDDRLELYQLLPLLVHALLFGGSYRSAAERVALRYSG